MEDIGDGGAGRLDPVGRPQHDAEQGQPECLDPFPTRRGRLANL